MWITVWKMWITFLVATVNITLFYALYLQTDRTNLNKEEI